MCDPWPAFAGSCTVPFCDQNLRRMKRQLLTSSFTKLALSPEAWEVARRQSGC
jgi:hypothetical protein